MAESEEVIINVKVEGADGASSEMDNFNKSVEQNTEDIEQNEDSQKSYQKTLGDSVKDMKIFGVSINSMSAAFKGSVTAIRASITGLKALKVAIAATGIGLLVIALGSLFTFFQRSQQGADLLSKGLRVVGNIINVLLDRISEIGKAIVQVFEGDWSGAAETARNAVTGITDAVIENINRAIELENQLVSLRRASINLTVQEAAYRAEIAKNRDVLQDTLKTTEERLAAGKQALAFEEQLADVRANNLRREIAIAKEALKESETLDEDRQAVAELEAQLIDINTQKYRSQTRIRTFLNTLITKDAKEQEEIRAQEEIQIEEGKQLDLLAIETKGVQDFQTLADQKLGIIKSTSEAELEIAETKDGAILASGLALLGGLAQAAGQNTIFGKAAAIAEATINTWVGVTTVLRDGTLPTLAKVGFVAANLATGFAAVKQILGTPIPKVQVQATPFADGGFIGGRPHSQGGTWVNAEKGEYMISKDRMAIPSIRRSAMALNNYKQSGGGRMALGGDILAGNDILSSSLNRLERAVLTPQVVLVTEDLDFVQNRVSVVESRASLS